MSISFVGLDVLYVLVFSTSETGPAIFVSGLGILTVYSNECSPAI